MQDEMSGGSCDRAAARGTKPQRGWTEFGTTSVLTSIPSKWTTCAVLLISRSTDLARTCECGGSM